MTRWLLLKDILLTGTGMALVLSQVFVASPSDLLLVTGLAFTVPSITAHAKTILGAGTSGPSSPSPSSPGQPPSGHSAGAAGE